jgi:hypothetical protein
MAKRIRISDDAGTTWYTLPGNTGDRRLEASQINDTVFGQSYESQAPGLIQGMLTSNAIWKAAAGYQATIKKGGTSTSMTAEACSLVSGKTYQITNTAKRVIDYDTALTVYGNAIAIAASNIESIDYLTGKVTFISSYTPTTPITITGNYMPMATFANCKAFTLTQSAAEIDTTVYETAQANGGIRTFVQGLKTIGLELQGVQANSATNRADLLARSLFYAEIAPAGGGDFFRGFFKRANTGRSGQNGALEEENLSLALYVPDGSLVLNPFSWTFGAGTVLNTAIQKVINAYAAGTVIKVQYLPDGTVGEQVDAIVTEATLSNDIGGLNEFRYGFRATGAYTAI